MDIKKVVADDGYKHPQCVTPANISDRKKAGHAFYKSKARNN